MVENEEEKNIDNDLIHDYPLRRESPAILITGLDDLEFKGGPAFLGVSKGGGGGSIIQKGTLKLLKTSREVENIFKKEKDDIVAEIIDTVKSIRETFYGELEEMYGMTSKLENIAVQKRVSEIDPSDPIRNAFGTLRFDLPPERKLNSFNEDLDELEEMYKKLQN